MNAATLQTLLIYTLPVVFAITVHEAAHGYAARYFGDNTAATLGRLTLNPIPHIDLFGTILMPLLLYIATSGNFLFGYAKPVPVNFGLLRKPRRDMIWVALAGPFSNLVQAILWALVWTVMLAAGVEERFFLTMAQAGILVNLVMCALNLCPLPPLDGGRVLLGFLPPKPAYWLSRVEPFGFYIVLALILTGIMSNFWLKPLIKLGYLLLNLLIWPLRALLS